VEKYGRTREIIEYNIIRRMNFAWLISKDTDTHSEYEIHYYIFTATMVTRMRLDVTLYRGADKSVARPGKKQARKYVRDARDFSKIGTRAVINFLFLQVKAPKEIHAILTETLAFFLPGRAKDLSAPLYLRCLSCSHMPFRSKHLLLNVGRTGG